MHEDFGFDFSISIHPIKKGHRNCPQERSNSNWIEGGRNNSENLINACTKMNNRAAEYLYMFSAQSLQRNLTQHHQPVTLNYRIIFPQLLAMQSSFQAHLKKCLNCCLILYLRKSCISCFLAVCCAVWRCCSSQLRKKNTQATSKKSDRRLCGLRGVFGLKGHVGIRIKTPQTSSLRIRRLYSRVKVKNGNFAKCGTA